MENKLSNMELIQLIERDTARTISLVNSLKNRNLTENDFEQQKQLLFSSINNISRYIELLKKE